MRRSRLVALLIVVIVFLGCGLFLSQATGHADGTAPRDAVVAGSPSGHSVDVGNAGQWAVAGLLGLGSIMICLRPRRRAVTVDRGSKDHLSDAEPRI